MRSTRIEVHIDAPPAEVYRAIIDAGDVAIWMAPQGMTSQVHSFDGHEGGTFRISLTYESPTATGKTSAQTDTFHGRFAELVPDKRIVQVLEFETTDPEISGEMTITYELAGAKGGTDLTAVHAGLPPALDEANNELGWRMSLAKLAELVERR